MSNVPLNGKTIKTFDYTTDAVKISGAKDTLDDLNDIAVTDVLADSTPFNGADVGSIKSTSENIYSTVLGLENSTNFSAAIPSYIIPAAGNKAYYFTGNLYDAAGLADDPDNNEICIRIIQSNGAALTGRLYKDLALTTALDDPTDGVNFPPASGWKAMERSAVGKYFGYFKATSADSADELIMDFGWTIAAALVGSERSAALVVDTNTKIDNIYVDTQALVSRLDNLQVDTTPSEGSITTDGSEQTIVAIDNTATPLVETVGGYIDFTNQTDTETTVIRYYAQIDPAGAYVLNAESEYPGVQDPLLMTLAERTFRYKFKITIEKTTGTNKAYRYQIFKKVQA